MKIWHNTALVDQLTLPAVGAAWLLGDGAFESLRTYNSTPFALDRHIRRLQQSLRFLNIPSPSDDEILRAVTSVIAANPCRPFGRLRIAIYGDGQWFVTHSQFEQSDKALSLARYQGTRFSKSTLHGIKSASYAENAFALRKARSEGFDDALFINEDSEVLESALANVIWREEGRWFTPALASGCLPGVTRGLLIEEFGVIEGSLSDSRLATVEALALTSSVREIVAVERYEGNLYPTSKPLQELQASFHEWILGKLNP